MCVWDDKDERSGQPVVWAFPDTDVLAQDYRGDEYYEISVPDVAAEAMRSCRWWPSDG